MAYNGCMPPPDKSIVWLKGQVITPPFSERARVLAGHLLRQLQRGEMLTMPDSRPMPVVEPECHELRVRDVDHFWRLMYYVSVEEIVVLEVWSKKTQRTPDDLIKDCRRRLRAYLAERQEGN